LRIVEERRKFRIETDSSDVVIRVVLLQQWEEWYLVAFISRKLIDVKTRYFTYDKEILAFGYILKKWRCYVQGLEFEVYTDHHTLVNLTTQKKLKDRQARWLDLMVEFRIEIKYQIGKKNIVADVLSRKVDHQVKMIEKKVTAKWLIGWAEAYRKNDDFGVIWKRKDPRQYTKTEHTEKHFLEYYACQKVRD
jgi:RNase H-like domain found in reverse transcriptase